MLHRWGEAMVDERGENPASRQLLADCLVLGLVAYTPGAAVDEHYHGSEGRLFWRIDVHSLLRMEPVRYVEYLAYPFLHLPG
jgi:hypothetical protein